MAAKARLDVFLKKLVLHLHKSEDINVTNNKFIVGDSNNYGVEKDAVNVINASKLYLVNNI